jgi:hypothetical protein
LHSSAHRARIRQPSYHHNLLNAVSPRIMQSLRKQESDTPWQRQLASDID